jgi:hypothetical protein
MKCLIDTEGATIDFSAWWGSWPYCLAGARRAHSLFGTGVPFPSPTLLGKRERPACPLL